MKGSAGFALGKGVIENTEQDSLDEQGTVHMRLQYYWHKFMTLSSKFLGFEIPMLSECTCRPRSSLLPRAVTSAFRLRKILSYSLTVQ